MIGAARRIWWFVFALGCVAIAGGLTWITAEMLRLEKVERRANYEDKYEGGVRLALWRMESWLAPRLAREATRPYFQYLPYYPQQRAYDSMWREIVSGEVQTPSPLLWYESPLFLLHFQIDDEGQITSPQVPEGNALDVAQSTLITAERVTAKRALLKELKRVLGDPRSIDPAVALLEERVGEMLADVSPGPGDLAVSSQKSSKWAQDDVSRQEQARRAQNYAVQSEVQTAQELEPSKSKHPQPQSARPPVSPPGFGASGMITVGPFVPMWLDDLDEVCLFEGGAEGSEGEQTCVMVLVRRVHAGDETRVQGTMIDWTMLRSLLLTQIADLFPKADLRILRNAEEADRHAGRALAQIPVGLVVAPPVTAAVAGMTPTRVTLILVWLAFLVAVIAVAITLRASVAYGEKRSRFASAVTHELRTPLTTFRMYSEMLATGMVTDDEQRRTYLNTLKTESDRLAALVENVLAYARLERGRTTLDPQPIEIARLLDDALPALERRAADAGLRIDLRIDGAAGQTVRADAEAVRQILLNLVDNACKYACTEEAACPLQLEARTVGETVELALRDHGPGITTAQARSIFEPFERGGRPPGDTTPGVGLGLALSRGLARRLGGDLRLDGGSNGGACFRLTLRRFDTGAS